MINTLSEVCNQSNIVQLFLLLKIAFKIACTIIPIIIIVPTVKDLIVNVSNGKSEELKKTFTTFVKRLISGLAIFFIPTIINYLFTEIVPGKTQEIFACIDSASMEKVKQLREKEAEEAKNEREKKQEEIEDANEKSAEEAKKRASAGKTLKKERGEESTTGNPSEDVGSSTGEPNQNVEVSTGGLTAEDYKSKISSMSTPTMSMLESAAAQNNISTDYLKVIIGTTHNEGYYNDPYLYYGWASAMINNKVSVAQMQAWDPAHSGEANFYSQTNINKGYNNATDNVLKSVYLALTERNTKIIECNGMYSTTPSSYNLIYKSTAYNCAIYEKK